MASSIGGLKGGYPKLDFLRSGRGLYGWVEGSTRLTNMTKIWPQPVVVVAISGVKGQNLGT